MASIYKFQDSDGEVKWGEISIGYNPNNPVYRNSQEIPVVIDQGYVGAGEMRHLKIDDIIESR